MRPTSIALTLALRQFRRLLQTTLGIAAMAVSSLLTSGCSTPEPPQVKLEKANILPLAIDSNFAFRKKTQFLNDPSTYIKTGQLNEAIDFERRYYMWPATTALDMDALRGNYLNFFWKKATPPYEARAKLSFPSSGMTTWRMDPSPTGEPSSLSMGG